MNARLVAALGAIVCLVILGGCGTQATAQPTPHMSPDPSPTPSPNVLTEKQILTRYLAEFGKWDGAESNATGAMNRLFDKVHEHWYDQSSAEKHKMAHTALEIARKFDSLSVDYGALAPLPYLVKSQGNYVRFLRLCYAAMLHYSTYLRGGASSDSELKASDQDFQAAVVAGREWAFALRVAARRLGVKIPFKITQD
jgi:hypothetical protein